MKESYSHLSTILDRTGSMQTNRDDIIGGFNAAGVIIDNTNPRKLVLHQCAYK